VTKRRKPRARTERRALARSEEKLIALRERLFQHEAGSTSANPIVVPSASVVEARAAGTLCPRCQTGLRVEAHEAVSADPQRRLRRVRARCPRCGGPRTLWFELQTPKLN